jgi:hypothetical protein
MGVNVCLYAYIGLILMWETLLVYEITNAIYIQLLVTPNRLLVNA